MTQTQVDKTIVVGVFGSEEDAQRAVMQLHREGYSSDDIQTVAEKNPEPDEPGEVKAETVTKSYTGLIVGAAIGGVVGLVIGLLFGGIWPVVGLIIGVALGVLGGSMGGLSWARQPTKGLEKVVQAGNWLVTIQSSDLAAAQASLRKAGAIGVKTQTNTPTQVKKT